MTTTQIHSFLPYESGINPQDLRIGSLFLNIFNIEESQEDSRFEYRQDLKDQAEYEKAIAPWSAEPKIDTNGYGINFELSKDTSMSVKLSEWIKADGGANGTVTAFLEGTSGRRLRIKKTSSFLKDSVMEQHGAKQWIRTQASVVRKSLHHGSKFKAPPIWMCTGVQLVTNGRVQTGSSRHAGYGIGVGADIGAAAGGPPGVAVLKAEGAHDNNAHAGNYFGYQGERVWAAQFMEINFKFDTEPDPENKEHPKTIAKFDLEDIADLKARGLRAGQDERLQATGQTPTPPLPLVAKITTVEDKEVVAGQETEIIQISDGPYVKSMQDTDWESYNECLKFLADADAERGFGA